jgi:hypothetical protein
MGITEVMRLLRSIDLNKGLFIERSANIIRAVKRKIIESDLIRIHF